MDLIKIKELVDELDENGKSSDPNAGYFEMIAAEVRELLIYTQTLRSRMDKLEDIANAVRMMRLSLETESGGCLASVSLVFEALENLETDI